MKIAKLNCTACGAPISIPEDLDILFCSSCGSKLAVDRGEGYISLKLVEKLTQAIQDSGDKAHSAIQENTFVTKVELKKVQISQSINTEEIKLNSIRQEIRGLTRKPQLMPVELEQLSTLRLEECNSLMRIRKLNMDSAKLDEGWEESMQVFQADLASLNEIINKLSPFAANAQTTTRLNELLQERSLCENALVLLETRLLSRQLRSKKYAPVNTLTVEEMESLRQDIQTDMNLLASPPQSAVKASLRVELNQLLASVNAFYPRKKVESFTGELKSLDLHPPFSEIPWELIPLIELATNDLARVNQSPDNPNKFLVKKEIENTARILKERQAMDIPSRKIKRKKLIKMALIVGIPILAVIVILLMLFGKKMIGAMYGTNPDLTQFFSFNQYQPVTSELLEVVAKKTYLRPRADINSQEGRQLLHGEMALNLGQAADASDWYLVQLFSDNSTGYLYQQWVSPIHGESIKASPMTSAKGNTIYKENFSEEPSDWFEDTISTDFGDGVFNVSDGKYQADITTIEPGYFYSTIDIADLPSDYYVKTSTELITGSGLNASGLMLNFVDPDNFDYFLISSDGQAIIGARRNGSNQGIYNTADTSNKFPVYDDSQNELSVLVEATNGNGPNKYTYAVNGYAIYTLEYSQPQKSGPTVGLIVWSLENNGHAVYRFDHVTIVEK